MSKKDETKAVNRKTLDRDHFVNVIYRQLLLNEMTVVDLAKKIGKTRSTVASRFFKKQWYTDILFETVRALGGQLYVMFPDGELHPINNYDKIK